MNFERLPLFPLGLVLFPGAVVPLHLFEPRYRQLLKDVQADDYRFGIICSIPQLPARRLPAGRVGCVAEVTEVEMLPDGRSNIVVVGRERFALDRFLDDPAPYHVVRATPVEDDADGSPVALVLAADELASNFRRAVRAVHAISHNDTPPPDLPDDPGQLSWTIGAMIDLDLEARQRLLSGRSPMARLATLDAILRRALPDLEFQAAMQRR